MSFLTIAPPYFDATRLRSLPHTATRKGKAKPPACGGGYRSRPTGCGKNARHRFDITNIEFITQDISRLEFNPGTIDGCLCYNTFQLLGNSQARFLSTVRCVSSRGSLMLGFPSDTYLFWIWERCFRADFPVSPRNAFRLSWDELLFRCKLRSPPCFYVPEDLFIGLARDTGWTQIVKSVDTSRPFPHA
jgi:hypothetical protein